MNRYEAARMIAELVAPGQCLTISRNELRDCEPIPGFSVPDSIMENIIGSAYEFAYHVDPRTGHLTFSRLDKPTSGDVLTYVSPDRRHHFAQMPNGMWKPK